MEMLAGSDLWRSLAQTPPRSGTHGQQVPSAMALSDGELKTSRAGYSPRVTWGSAALLSSEGDSPGSSLTLSLTPTASLATTPRCVACHCQEEFGSIILITALK